MWPVDLEGQKGGLTRTDQKKIEYIVGIRLKKLSEQCLWPPNPTAQTDHPQILVTCFCSHCRHLFKMSSKSVNNL